MIFGVLVGLKLPDIFLTGEKKKEVDFVGSMSTKIKFILIHNIPTVIIDC